VNHHPFLAGCRRLGWWSVCRCGWKSRWSYTTVSGAHLAFGTHLLESAHAPREFEGSETPR